MGIVLERVEKQYKTLKALDIELLTLEKGIYGLLGANGAGKTTFLSIISGLIEQDRGTVFYEDTDIRRLGREYRRLVGFVPQEEIYYPQYTAREFLQYMALLKGLKPRERSVKEQLSALIETFHLEPYQNKRMKQLSGGTRKRVLLAQALIGDPRILILDEPTTGLDPGERVSMKAHIVKEAEERYVLLATHIASDLERLADRILVMKQGQIVQDAPPDALLAQVPAGDHRPTLEDAYMYYC